MYPLMPLPQGAVTCLAGQLSTTGGTCDGQDEARAGHHCSDELPDRVGCGQQLLRLQAQHWGSHDPGNHDVFVQRLWPGVCVDTHTGHEHRR